MCLSILRVGLCVAVLFLGAQTTQSSLISTGTSGIQSTGLGLLLTGDGIAIGQVEGARPGLPGFDMAANSNSAIVPVAVFASNGAPTADVDIGGHAERVAGVMISTDSVDSDMDSDAPVGVAPNANLYASADKGTGPDFDPEGAIAAQHVATRNGGDVRAVNLSFGTPLAGGAMLDGNSLLTQFIDWSAAHHDTLYVIAGNAGVGGDPIPTDNFNGMTVAYSTTSGGVYRQVDPDNFYGEDAEGDRTSVDILAPGRDIEVAGLGGSEIVRSGTSYAAPHVTGTVALLQEYGDDQIAASEPGWDADARRHEVMKAVLMNSADKLIDDGTVMVNGNAVPAGGLLGMTRTVLKKDGTSTWLDSSAYDDSVEGFGSFEPLDVEMGTGHLNARRALQQFIPGEYQPGGANVPSIGWDYGTTAGEDTFNRYRFEDEFRDVKLQMQQS